MARPLLPFARVRPFRYLWHQLRRLWRWMTRQPDAQEFRPAEEKRPVTQRIPSNPEDAPKTLIFIDMLGFAQFTAANPTRTIEFGPDEDGNSGSATTPLQSRVNRFQQILDHVIREEQLSGGVSAMIFSDCAYVDVGTALRAAHVAIKLMNLSIAADVPVRVGIGTGTFYGFKYSTELVGTDMITKALFAGTAVVNAHAAEQCGAKGCRIFVHPSAEGDLRAADSPDARVLALDPPLKKATSELCYLPRDPMSFRMDPRYRRKRYVNEDLATVERIKAMAAASEPAPDEVRIQYTETLKAIDRMRARLGRGVSLEQAERDDAEAANEEDAIADSTAGD